jgi:hypothetical protein
MPDKDKQQRRRIALDHQFKCLVRARQLHESLDSEAIPPPNLEMHLFAGDAMKTLNSIVVDEGGVVLERRMTAGDGTVSRTSAVSRPSASFQDSPLIQWDSWMFLSTDHIGLTRDRAFVDNVLSRLLSRPASDQIEQIQRGDQFEFDWPSVQPEPPLEVESVQLELPLAPVVTVDSPSELLK